MIQHGPCEVLTTEQFSCCPLTVRFYLSRCFCPLPRSQLSWSHCAIDIFLHLFPTEESYKTTIQMSRNTEGKLGSEVDQTLCDYFIIRDGEFLDLLSALLRAMDPLGRITVRVLEFVSGGPPTMCSHCVCRDLLRRVSLQTIFVDDPSPLGSLDLCPTSC